MADEATTQAQEPETAQPAETDWKAKYEEMRGHMRDWEKKAKDNQSAADELERLRAEQMTEQERERARADAAEAELAALKAEKEHLEAAQRIAADSGIPLDMLLFCKDEEAMTDFSKVYADNKHVGAAPTALAGRRIVRSESEKRSNGDLFAEVVEPMLKN